MYAYVYINIQIIKVECKIELNRMTFNDIQSKIDNERDRKSQQTNEVDHLKHYSSR